MENKELTFIHGGCDVLVKQGERYVGCAEYKGYMGKKFDMIIYDECNKKIASFSMRGGEDSDIYKKIAEAKLLEFLLLKGKN